nr:AzlD domain-containing protein [Streptomyces sp. HNM0574]
MIAAVAVAAAVTWALRAVPFAALAPLRESPVLHYLSAHMPAGIMVVLVAYSVHNADLRTPPHAAALGIALIVTVGLHLWRGNALLSILTGTAVHVALASTILAA